MVLEFLLKKVSEKAKTFGFFEEISPELDLISSGLYDSLSFLELIAELEIEFDKEFDYDEYSPADYSKVINLAMFFELD